MCETLRQRLRWKMKKWKRLFGSSNAEIMLWSREVLSNKEGQHKLQINLPGIVSPKMTDSGNNLTQRCLNMSEPRIWRSHHRAGLVKHLSLRWDEKTFRLQIYQKLVVIGTTPRNLYRKKREVQLQRRAKQMIALKSIWQMKKKMKIS